MNVVSRFGSGARRRRSHLPAEGADSLGLRRSSSCWPGFCDAARMRLRSSAFGVLLLVACSSTPPAGSSSSSGAGGAGQQAGGADGGGSGSRAGGAVCEATRSALESEIGGKLDVAAGDASVTSVTSFTLVLETFGGHRFVYTHGDSSPDTSYESASTSKWVAAAVILDLVDRGLIALDDEPSDYLSYWTTTAHAPGVTLAQLLSFTSGFSQEPLCFNLPDADFAVCVQRAYELNVDQAAAPGSQFDYSSTHLQVAGMMAVNATGSAGFSELFAAWQNRTGLFPSGAFDLPSTSNPRLAGGMHWTANDYMEFLRAIASGELLEASTREAMLANQRGGATVVGSPTLDALDQDWAYGFGNWLECPTAHGADSYDCGVGHRNSSPGAYGAYPFIDWDGRYFGMLARQGPLGTFREGDALYQTVAEDITSWANACDE